MQTGSPSGLPFVSRRCSNHVPPEIATLTSLPRNDGVEVVPSRNDGCGLRLRNDEEEGGSAWDDKDVFS